MADELELVRGAIEKVEGEISGILRAEGLLEGLPEFPLFVNYFTTGTFTYSQGRGCVGVHQLNADLHLGRTVLPSDEMEVIPFILLTMKKFAANLQLGGLCEHCLLKGYTIGGFNYGTETKTYGVRFGIEIKVSHGGVTVDTG